MSKPRLYRGHGVVRCATCGEKMRANALRQHAHHHSEESARMGRLARSLGAIERLVRSPRRGEREIR